ncbi:hypothetical protein PAXRUDRAFT_137653 [Paxillus rubicundulus Ve08.2h10]|uniref:Uncharacterized protein n=1 Tax=Paxillus rubicundulus Ve08.2h10 TaxID=930991 RepID=A0A0D0DG41_9AGAM|nr:hypothetical protein PAXRUDRAFT_137653 [Paxillus rubicundulus Ve08.2h10]
MANTSLLLTVSSVNLFYISTGLVFPQRKVLLSIAVLNTLSGKFSMVQTQVASLLCLSSKDCPFTSADICACLDTEQQLPDNEKAQASYVALMATPAHPKYNHPHSEKTCMLCRKQGHTVEGCWQPGGVALDGLQSGAMDLMFWTFQSSLYFVNKLACRGNSQLSSGHSTPHPVSTSTGSVPPSGCYNKSGCTYIIDSVTSSAVFLASVHTVPALPTPMVPPVTSGTSEFTGLVHDAILQEFLFKLSVSDQFEFDALVAHIGDLTTPVDWHHHSAPFNFTHLHVAAPNQCVNTVINPSTKPSFIDTGASVHISDTAPHFYSLHPIPQCHQWGW